MKTYFITFRSITYAQRGEKLLALHGYRCQLRRTPRWMEEKGCGYCLRLKCEDIGPWVAILRRRGVAFRRVYIRQPDGEIREVTV